jgi:CrcB protein
MYTAWMKVLLIAGGGACGSVLRYGLQGLGQKLVTGSFPLGTLIVNVVGCLLIGFLNRAFTGVLLVREEYRLALTVGVLGGFTTFSAFGWETFSLVNDKQYTHAAANVLLSIALGLVAVWIGYRLAERWLGV